MKKMCCSFCLFHYIIDELRADLIVRGPTMKVIEVTITDPCSNLLHDHHWWSIVNPVKLQSTRRMEL